MATEVRAVVWVVVLSATGSWFACTPKTPLAPGSCRQTTDCHPSMSCVAFQCVAPADGDASIDGSVDTGDAAGMDGGCATPCGDSCCDDGDVCMFDECVTEAAECATSDDCLNDSFCDVAMSRCVAYDDTTAMNDETCHNVIVAGTFAPTVQCEFREAPEDDAFPDHLHVLSTPMVVDFRIGRTADDPAAPSIVAVFDDGVDGGEEEPTGVIRVLDGSTCAQQAELGSLQLVSHSSPPAVADLDGDGRAEIIANQGGGGLAAFRYDDVDQAWEVLWHSTEADGTTPFNVSGGGWAGPTIYDLDDDGIPEVLRGGVVLDRDGKLVSQTVGVLSDGDHGRFGVVADVDADGHAELVEGNHVWEWNTASSDWVLEAWSPEAGATGHVALADFGSYAGANDWSDSTPEVVVVGSEEARVQTLDGTVLYGPVALPGGGAGGPPTIADFDGDSRPEFATAGSNNYVVYDLDCTAMPVGACASGRTDGVLWDQPSQDESSNQTGSSVFDFEGDGRAEAVYGDECFVRVYDGETGEVVFSQMRSSCTWYENPVIADVDGDFNAEIVIGNNYNCGSADSGIACNDLDPGNLDPLFAGLRCSEATDCLSGDCVEGFCRCESDAQCCSGVGCELSGFTCATPPDGTPGEGSTCRAGRPYGALGIRVYRDVADRWVRSRMIWNQHAYYVTNVEEDGTVPSTSQAVINWQTPGLNNFRQNVQGEGSSGDAPDLTGGGGSFRCGEGNGVATIETRVCNRGTEPVGAGLAVHIYDGAPETNGTLLCDLATSAVLEVGSCEMLSCDWDEPPSSGPGTTLTIVADAESENMECHEGNNRGTIEAVFCVPIF